MTRNGDPRMTEPTPATPAEPAEPVQTPTETVHLPDDHPLVKTLAAQKEQIRQIKEQARLDAEKAQKFDQIQEENKTETEKALARAEAAEKELTTSRLDAARASIALEKKLTPSQAKRLVGTTREELEADADELLADLQSTAPVTPASPSADGQGNQGDPVGAAKQIQSLDDLKGLSPEQVVALKDEGRLNGLLGITP